jgi:hypothetical protein
MCNMAQRGCNALITCARFNGLSNPIERSVMKALFASLSAVLLALAAISVYAASPIASAATFTPDTASQLPSEEDKDKDKDKDKDEKKKDG